MFLHEMLHMPYTFNNLMGLSDPPGKDIVVRDRNRSGRAYDPARAKWLATYILGGQAVVKQNVDNFVYFALWHYVLNRWDVQANKPLSEWPLDRTTVEGYPDYRDGITDLPDSDYEGSVNQTLVDASGFVVYGGKPCMALSDCDGVCPPGETPSCEGQGDETKTCYCNFTFNPPSL